MLTTIPKTNHTYPAPAKSGVGFGDLNLSKAHKRPFQYGAFFVPAVYVMAARTRETFGSAGPLGHRFANLRFALPPEFGDSGGGLSKLSKEAAAMATVPTPNTPNTLYQFRLALTADYPRSVTIKRLVARSGGEALASVGCPAVITSRTPVTRNEIKRRILDAELKHLARSIKAIDWDAPLEPEDPKPGQNRISQAGPVSLSAGENCKSCGYACLRGKKPNSRAQIENGGICKAEVRA